MSQPQNLSTRTRVALVWAGGEAVLRVGIHFGVLIVLARLLTPVEFGIVGAAQIIVGMVYVFALLGVGPALVQRVELERRHLETAWSFSIIFGLVSALVMALLAPALGAFFGMPLLTQALQMLSLVFPMAGCSVVPESLLQRELSFRTLARIEVSSNFIGLVCVTIVLAALRFGLWALVVGQLVQIALRSLQMMIAARSWPRWSFQARAFQELLHFSAGQSAANLANYVATNGDNLIVGKFLGAAPMGIYSRAYLLMLAPALLVGSVLEKVLFPVLSKVQQEPALLKRAYRQSNHLLAVSVLPVAAAIYLLAPDAIPIALGAKWAGVVLPLQLFSIGLLWRVGMKVSNSFIRACGAVRTFAVCQICYAASVILCAWVGSRAGIPGVCVGVLAAIFGCYAFAAVVCLRLTGLRLGEFLVDHVPGTALGGSVALTGWILLSWMRATHARSIPSLAVTAGGMGAVAIVAIAIFPQFLLGVYGEKLKAKLRLPFSIKRFPNPSVPATSDIVRDRNHPSHRMETLDSFRGLAAFGVMIYHYGLRYGEVVSPNPNQVPEGHGLFLQLLFPWFFFVISGFVIFMTLSRTKNDVDFLVSRFSRLFPAYWAAVAVTCTFMAVFPLAGRTYPLHVGVINLTMLQGWLFQPNVDGVYWTLMIELSFYALMYLLFRLKQLDRIEWIGSAWLIGQCAVAFGQRALHHQLPSIVSNTFLLSWFQFFFAGVLFYHLRTYGFTWRRCLILALCVVTQWIVYDSPAAAGDALVFFILFVLFLYDRLHFLCTRPLLYLGAISYPLYLIHQNIGYTTIHHLSLLGLPQWAGVLTACTLSLALASLLTFFVEKPALKAIRNRYRQYQARSDQLAAVVAPSRSMLH